MGGLFERITSFENLLAAAREAQRGKRYRKDVLTFNLRLEDRLHELKQLLEEGSWRPRPHRHFRIREPKQRWISAAPYRDRVVHHAICRVIGPVLERRMIFDSWANRRGKGSHRAVLRYQSFAARFRYALKIDLRKYFASIDHAILVQQLARSFREPRLLQLLSSIIHHGEIPEPHVAYFPGDTLLTPLERKKGLPIGNLTSQLWANTYLCAFDHWVKERLGARGYLRFVDDFVLLHDSREVLSGWLSEIKQRLAELRLLVHEGKCVIRRTDEGLPFLGYVVWPGRIRVRGATLRRFRRRLRRHPASSEQRKQSLASWRGHLRIVGSWRRGMPGGLSAAGLGR